MSKTIVVEGQAVALAAAGYFPTQTYHQSKYEADDFKIDEVGMLEIFHAGERIAVHPQGKWNRVFVEQAKAEKPKKAA